MKSLKNVKKNPLDVVKMAVNKKSFKFRKIGAFLLAGIAILLAEKWYIGGHSLRGAMAASYLSGCADSYEGLLLLGSYSTEDFSNTDLSVLSIYGSEDMVLNREKYEECK